MKSLEQIVRDTISECEVYSEVKQNVYGADISVKRSYWSRAYNGLIKTTRSENRFISIKPHWLTYGRHIDRIFYYNGNYPKRIYFFDIGEMRDFIAENELPTQKDGNVKVGVRNNGLIRYYRVKSYNQQETD